VATPQKVFQIAQDIVRREGNFGDDPDDKGGPTKHGVSLRYARGVGLDNDGDGDTDRDDILLVTPEQAAALFIEDFYDRPRLHLLPEGVQPNVFDAAVNAGPGVAIVLYQRALNGLGCRLFEDGVLGPKTLNASAKVTGLFGWMRLNNAYVHARLAYYAAITRENPSQKKFLKGWARRAESFLV